MKNHTNECNILTGPQGRCTCENHVTITPLQGEFRKLIYEHEELTKEHGDLKNWLATTQKQNTALWTTIHKLRHRSYWAYWIGVVVGAVASVLGNMVGAGLGWW